MLLHLLLIAASAQSVPSPDALARRAQEDLKMERYSAACQKLELAVKASPRNASFWFLLGIARSKLAQEAPAIAAFEKSVAIDPHQAPAYFNLGILYGYRGDTAKAIEVYKQGLRITPDDLPANQNYAFLLLKTKRFREAIESLRKLKKANASNVPARTELIECYWKSGMTTEAERETQEFLNSASVSDTDRLGLAKMLMEDGEPSAAQKVLEHLVASSPSSAEGHGKLGLLLSNEGQFEEAARQLGRAVQLAPDVAEYSMGLAQVLLLWGHSPTALDFLMAVKPRFDQLPEFHYDMALAYFGMHKFDKSIKVLQELDGQHPGLSQVHYLLGNSYFALGDLQDAELQYRKAIEIDPRKAIYYSALALLLRKRGTENADERIRLLQKALALNPSDVQSKLELGLCYEGMKKLGKAQALLERVVSSEPKLLQAHVALARVYYRLGKKEQGDQEGSTIARLEEEQRLEQSRIRESFPSPRR
jgi:tetratricopeptide (TPR) repeat protein